MPALAIAAIASPASRKTAIEVRPPRLAMAIEHDGRHERAHEGRQRQQLVLQEADAFAETAVGEDDRGGAANAPPEETPTSAGSASGLRNRPCMMAPDVASSAPTMAAAAMRGMRIDHSTSWSRAVSGCDGRSADKPKRRRQTGERNSGRADGRAATAAASQHDEQAAEDEEAAGGRTGARAPVDAAR